jgi:hypothetical protein
MIRIMTVVICTLDQYLLNFMYTSYSCLNQHVELAVLLSPQSSGNDIVYGHVL